MVTLLLIAIAAVLAAVLVNTVQRAAKAPARVRVDKVAPRMRRPRR